MGVYIEEETAYTAFDIIMIVIVIAIVVFVVVVALTNPSFLRIDLIYNFILKIISPVS